MIPNLILQGWSALALMAGGAAVAAEADFLSGTRQLTYEGRRAGEGYFSADGTKLIFQSERDPANPFFQIFLMDLESGDVTRVSPGAGKTTCAWIHPSGRKLMFSSTHEDATSKDQQAAELQQRAEGKMKRYSWDYDEQFEIFEAALDGSGLKNLTRARGYDAEGAYSPDGAWIVFSSNRHAYTQPLDEAGQQRLEIDKQYFLDLYRMRADGSDVQRLTDTPGYDGGPFFSADGRKICWRRFDEKGERAEIWTMNADGSDQQQITRLEALSWAPFFHPSGEYLIFSTNLQGFDNFELYIVRADGAGEPVRVTDTPGFDSLAAFSPDGKQLSWTSNRTEDKTSQLFLANWNHEAARAALGLGKDASANGLSSFAPTLTSAAISAADLRQHVFTLASEEMEGRLPGTKGEQLATRYAADVFQVFGLEPAGDDGTFFQPFEFTAGVELGEHNTLTLVFTGQEPPPAPATKADQDWRPLSFSTLGEIPPSEIVFAGYGIELEDEGPEKPGYSSYFHLDVNGKWAMVLRYMPEHLSGEQRNRFVLASGLRYKAMTARQHGAKGLIIVSGPNSKVREQLVPLTFDASLAGSGLAAMSITDALADKLLAPTGRTLKGLQDELDKGQSVQGLHLQEVKLGAVIDIKQEKRTGRNVLARLKAQEPTASPALLIGAHIDHLGREFGGNSRATEDQKGQIHYGADDNASGTAAVLEIAQWLAAEKSEGRLPLARDVIFALWSGEEAGLLGSAHFVKTLAKQTEGDEGAKLGGHLAAVLNLDMVGRLDKTLVLQGLGSSDWWKPQIEKRNVPVGLPLTLQSDCYAPTDTTSFYPRGVPILNAFTGNHEDYHRPTDTADKLNYDCAAKVTKLMALLARDLALADTAPEWKEYSSSERQGQRAAMRVYLGTVPDYSQGDIEGVKLSGVSPVGPAAKAGVRGGDVITGLGGKAIKNIYDYTYVLSELKVGEEAEITVLRDGQPVTLKITPTSRD